jgi:hypothetical protein
MSAMEGKTVQEGRGRGPWLWPCLNLSAFKQPELSCKHETFHEESQQFPGVFITTVPATCLYPEPHKYSSLRTVFMLLYTLSFGVLYENHQGTFFIFHEFYSLLIAYFLRISEMCIYIHTYEAPDYAL